MDDAEIDYTRTSSACLANVTGDSPPSTSFVAITAVSEPATLVLMAIGAGLAAGAGLRRRKEPQPLLPACQPQVAAGMLPAECVRGPLPVGS